MCGTRTRSEGNPRVKADKERNIAKNLPFGCFRADSFESGPYVSRVEYEHTTQIRILAIHTLPVAQCAMRRGDARAHRVECYSIRCSFSFLGVLGVGAMRYDDMI